MTATEKQTYQQLYRIPSHIVHHIPFFHVDDRIRVTSSRGRGVLSSGRNSCDWGTLLSAAEGRDWDLTIVCSAEDHPKIRKQAELIGARLLTEIPADEHDRLMSESRLYVLCLRDAQKSAGHVRLMKAWTLGTPVVATAVEGISGYEHLVVDLVPAGDSLSLGHAVDEALTEAAWQSYLEVRSKEEEEAWTYSKYLACIRALVSAA